MVVVHVGDQHVGPPVVVEVGNERVAGLAQRSVGSHGIECGLLRDVREATAAVVQVERVSTTAHEKQVDVAVAIDVLRCDSTAGERRRCLEQTVPELSQPTGRAVREVDSRFGGDIAEEVTAVGLRRGARGRHDDARRGLMAARALVAQRTVGGDRGRRGQVVRVETDGLDTLFGDPASQAE